MNIAMSIAHIEELDDIETDPRPSHRGGKNRNAKAVRILMRTRTDVQSCHHSSVKLERGRWHSSRS